ncbi:putative pectate lyase 4 [Dorcoceras hygrometricum]|uniref:Pectate lyase n=1 Tax=Dorcoceras hygrometricum TaxID=472368 RepID=A0A2Z7B433_9LAMI|nr:putative pectate lyase 4 [Dorcoceras hygrometricum]
MVPMGKQGRTWCLVWAISMAILVASGLVEAHKKPNVNMNVMDSCWRTNPNWRRNRHQLATCSVGYAGKMSNNGGRGTVDYVVTDPCDDPLNPKPGSLRFGVTSIKGKVWITFHKDMTIKLAKPLLVGSFTTLDGRGANVHIAGGAGLLLQEVNNVIIHGIHIHDCIAQGAGPVMGPDRKIVQLGPVDGDAIRLVSSSKIWIDHNTLQDCQDGLIDVTRGSTDITISNNWFRIRFGYAHVVNNLYLGWGIYAIGGSMEPSIKSQANLFIAPQGGNKQIFWGHSAIGGFRSVQDVFENGASFSASLAKDVAMRPNYRADQNFEVADGRAVKLLTRSAGALKCSSRC